MENFNQIEKDILDRINKIKDRSTTKLLKLKFSEKKGLLQRDPRQIFL